ncbi:MAG: DNA polymerase III subunit alpha [Planctomycetota bacterium]|nr:MAG: DNA polymerase III subunit alpha [Planctomycetota bacterium]
MPSATKAIIDIAAPTTVWPVAVRTWYSTLEGACSPEQWREYWGSALPPRMVLADRATLAALPEAITAWGRERVVPGCTLRLSDGNGEQDDDVLFIASGPRGYVALCQWLSWYHEYPRQWASWLHGGRGPELSGLSDVVALVRRQCHIPAVTRLQCATRWWLQPGDSHATDLPIPACAMALVDHRHGEDRESLALRQAVAQREGRAWAQACGLDQLASVESPCSASVAEGQALLRSASILPDLHWHMPPSLWDDAPAVLYHRAAAGLQRRYATISPALRQRFEHEMAVIIRKGFAGYVLTVADVADGRRTCGRGSGASSLVVYCLGITDVDPQRYALVFERFLNNARTDPPDLDVDFPWDERDAVLAQVLQRYGRDHVAMVANHCHLRRGSALRVAARAYGRRDGETSAVRTALRQQQRYGKPLNLPEPWPGILAAAHTLEGRPHHSGLHCGGIVITPDPIRSIVPVHPAGKRITDHGETIPLPVIDWDKDGAETMGLVKIDLLGNRSLAVVRDCLHDLRNAGITIDEARWHPADDLHTQTMVASGDTIGCFYIESPAMRQLQAKAGSGAFDALVVHSSIIRPAANHWIATYLQRLHDFRRHGQHRQEWYPHPSLENLLSESFGILSYQEDVMQVAQAMAGFNERQANALRKSLGHWGSGRLQGFAEIFRAGAQARGVAAQVIDQVWDMISSFAGYSFCKAHSASYAMLSFQCAWLKAHFPAIFLARVIAHQGGFYHHAAYLEDARRRGVRILGPCVQCSNWRTAAEGMAAIRCGLQILPGCSPALARRLQDERRRSPWLGIDDLRCRLRLDAGQLDTFARAGALDAIHPHYHRGQILWLARHLGLRPLPARDDPQQLRLLNDHTAGYDPPVPDLPHPTTHSCEQAQWQVLGCLPSRHPLHLVSAPASSQPCRALTTAISGSRLQVCVQVVTRKQVAAHPKRGGPNQVMAFVTVEDPTALIETVWFPQAYHRYGILLEASHPLILEGRVHREYDFPVLEVTYAQALLT